MFIKYWTCHFIAAVAALVKCCRYAGKLEISLAEWPEYVIKSTTLGLCYVGFGSQWTAKEASRAGQAAFLCCAYDVVTDWRLFDVAALKRFTTIVRECKVPDEAVDIALSLYRTEQAALLSCDGLSRGSEALRFILKVMDCERVGQEVRFDIERIGQLCQIVDDVWDYHRDLAHAEMNCLATPRRLQYLSDLVSQFQPELVRKLFGRGAVVLNFTIEISRRRAIRMIAQDERSGSEVAASNPIAGPGGV